MPDCKTRDKNWDVVLKLSCVGNGHETEDKVIIGLIPFY